MLEKNMETSAHHSSVFEISEKWRESVLQIRMYCLDQAIKTSASRDDATIIEVAKNFYEWITNEEEI